VVQNSSERGRGRSVIIRKRAAQTERPKLEKETTAFLCYRGAAHNLNHTVAIGALIRVKHAPVPIPYLLLGVFVVGFS
jgi:hypothetical protein